MKIIKNIMFTKCCYYCAYCIKADNSTKAFCKINKKKVDYNDRCKSYQEF